MTWLHRADCMRRRRISGAFLYFGQGPWKVPGMSVRWKPWAPK